MNRNDFLTTLGAAATVSAAGLTGDYAGRRIAGIAVPDSALARDAVHLALTTEHPQIFNHSLRTFLFAELMANAMHVRRDSELVFVASILHDLGLTSRFMSAQNRFEADGANAARDLMKHHGATDSAAETVWDAIALHDNGGLAKWKRAEVMLVNAGVGADFGGGLDVLQREHVMEVLRHAPRDGFIEAFLPAVAAVAAKKPYATGNCFVTDVGYRMVPGFHLPNFCDEVKDDPFAAYR